MRRGVLGEPASGGEARHHQEGHHVNAAGVGGKQLSLSGEACPGVEASEAATTSGERRWPTGQESAEAVVPVGIAEAGKGRTPGESSPDGLEMTAAIAATPRRRTCEVGKR